MTKWTRFVLWTASAGILLILFSGPGTRLAFWGFGVGLIMLALGFLLLLIGTVLAVILLTIRKGSHSEQTACSAVSLVGLVIIGYLYFGWIAPGMQAPAIHDITTDPFNPPAFEAILPLRADAPNSTDYPGGEVTEAQWDAYPEIQPLLIGRPYEEVFADALALVGEMGWDLVDADQASGRIEATDTTFWFGFRDDVVLRLQPGQNRVGTRVDMRSVSRVGQGDAGTNAERIISYLEALAVR